MDPRAARLRGEYLRAERRLRAHGVRRVVLVMGSTRVPRRHAYYALAREFRHRAGWELQNLLTVARVMIETALRREESRGTHYRSDFPDRDDVNGLKHLVCAGRG